MINPARYREKTPAIAEKRSKTKRMCPKVSSLTDIENEDFLRHNIERAAATKVYLPTFAQLKDPSLIPDSVKDQLKGVDKEEVNPLNLFRFGWYNGEEGFNDVPESFELPSVLTGVPCKIVILPGAKMPSNTHKSGPAYSNFVSKIVTGKVDITQHRVMFPSTGNYCRGGVLISKMLGANPLAVLPAKMSRERFEYMEKLEAEIIKTTGQESNIFNVVDNMGAQDDVVVCNQFTDMANPIFHYACTGDAMRRVWENMVHIDELESDVEEADFETELNLTGCFFASGSSGTLASYQYLKQFYPNILLGVGESVEGPILFENGVGATKRSRIEGTTDKIVPLVFNVREMDFLASMFSDDVLRLFRLFNEPMGHEYLKSIGVPQETIDILHYFGLSSCANIIGCIKMAKYYELNENDVLFTVATDSNIMYFSVLEELRAKSEYTPTQAAVDFHSTLIYQRTDYSTELRYHDLRRIHNLKHFTWVEQHHIPVDTLTQQWYRPNWFKCRLELWHKYDRLIAEFNKESGLMDLYDDDYQRSLLQ
ncbi:hypothetical protein PCE1_002319 [Barthelona sp. PCE]